MAGQDQVADDHALYYLLPLPLHRACLAHHLPDGLRRHREIICRPGKAAAQLRLGIL